jgi:hypothetical protein
LQEYNKEEKTNKISANFFIMNSLKGLFNIFI